MWVTKLMISPVKKRIFCSKTTKFGPKLAFLVNLGQAMQDYSVPCLWVGWWLWCAGCISQNTYLLHYIGLMILVIIKNIYLANAAECSVPPWVCFSACHCSMFTLPPLLSMLLRLCSKRGVTICRIVIKTWVHF